MKRMIFASLLFLATLSPAFCVDKKDVLKMINEFETSGILKASDAKEAKLKLDKITAKQWEEINKVTKETAESNPELKKKTQNNLDSASKNVDTDSAQFQSIQKILEIILGKKD